MAAALVAGVSITSCNDDTEPAAQIPTRNDFLNTPPTANYSIDLTQTSTVALQCSQPDYGGVATIPTYAVQISLDQKFATVPAEWEYAAGEPVPYIELPNPTNSTNIEIKARDIADAINAIRGYTELEQFDEAGYTDYEGPVYARVRAYFANGSDEQIEMYEVVSNIVMLSASVKAYPTLRQPGFIFLVGAPEGWVGPTPANAEHYEAWKLYEADDAIDSKIYSATFDIPANQFQFRFYTQLQDWDFNSVGSQDADEPKDVAMKDGVYSGSCVVGTEKGKGKGSWQIPGWGGGEVTITVNLKAKTVEFKKVN